MANTNIEVTKNSTETTPNLLRRFQKRVQEAGILSRVRGLRYEERTKSTLKVKRAKLRKLEKIAEYERLKRLGKVIERRSRR